MGDRKWPSGRRARNRLHMEPHLLGVLVVLILLLAAVGASRVLSAPVARVVAEPTEAAWSTGESGRAIEPAPQSDPVLFVYVTGAVSDPGVKQLHVGDRVADAIDAAGGPLPEASLDSVNLARQLVDGEQIDLPTTAEVDAPEVGPGLGIPYAAQEPCVDLNSADEMQLEALDGVGPSLAARILAHRQQYGPFASRESLLEVSGIGAKRLAAFESQLCQ